MKEKKYNPIELQNVTLIFKNFSGSVSHFNKEGYRKFDVLITDPLIANDLKNKGLNVKELKQEDSNPIWHLPVKISKKFFPGIYQTFEDNSMLQYDEDMVSELDEFTLYNVDVVLTPYHWTNNNNTGISMYLRKMYFQVELTEIQKKYKGFTIRK